jgi:hypothetical protein
MMMTRFTTLSRLLGATALTLIGAQASAQVDCGADYDVLPIGCEPSNAGSTVIIPVGANTEAATPAANGPQGFVISINGDAIAGDTQSASPLAKAVRSTDVALANADVQVTFDGLGTTPRLDLEIVGADRELMTGDTVTLQSALNYPAFVTRAEVRVIDLAARGGPRTIGVTPVAPNGQLTLTVPEGDTIVVVHRVYDAAGRYDETTPLSLARAGGDGRIDGVEDGIDSAARRRIPVNGGAITVRGTDVANGASVVALDEVVQVDPDGSFVIQRILPAGDYSVDVAVNGAGQNVNLTRDVTIPRSEWFGVGTVDLTYGQKTDGLTGEEATYSTGRVAFYIDGKTQNGTRITASVDTGEGDLDQIFRRLDERDPRTLLDRIDPRDLYPTYGDDSTSEDRTPTAGKIFLRIEKEANFVQWGNFDSDLGDNTFVRNERALYGLSAGVATRAQTSAGEARGRVLAYAAQPDMLPQRDTFLGTGGTVFFLEKQDIAGASETISIQLRDPDTGRIIETRLLVAGQDYEINYIQGILSLTRPLQSAVTDGLFSGGATGTSDVVLVAQYEFQPDAADLDGYAYGGRAEAWVTDDIRVGVSGMLDETGATDHQAIGADLLYAVSDETYLRLEYAQSEGTGFGSTFSADGGLIVADEAATGTEGTAIKISGRSSLADLGLGGDGAIGGYFEERTAGFSTLDVQTTTTTGDEQFWGVFADVAISDRVTIGLAYDSYENAVGEADVDAVVEATFKASDTLSYAIGVEHQDRSGGTDPGSRTDVAARLTYAPDDLRSVYVFGQATVASDGLEDNDRYGVGVSYGFDNGWAVSGEVSEGATGAGGRLAAQYTDDVGNTRYAGYEIDPNRTLDGISLNGRDQGRLVIGGSQQLTGQVSVFGENAYDVFGRHKSLTAAYGLTYRPSDVLSLTGAFEVGQVQDGDAYDFDRKALSFGLIYEDEMVSASGRVEYRVEDGVSNGIDVTADTLLVSAAAQYKIDEVQRFVFDADIARSETAQSPLLDGNYADVVLGYAYRPIEDNRLNVLARYRYLYDLYGLRDATGEDGPRQRSHVVSVDASYDLNRNWTVGGKIGYRSAQTAVDGASAFTKNNAWLAVANARYHLVHDWDALIEVRSLGLEAAGTNDTGVLGAVYKHMGNNVKLGVGYNFGRFSDDLTDLTYDDKGAFINLIAKF